YSENCKHYKKLISTPPTYLNLYYQNARSLNNKLSCLKSQAPCSKYDIFIFTGTWLKENVKYDRTNEPSSLSRGGGVLIAVRYNIYPKFIEILINNIELLFLMIKMSNLPFITGSVYMSIKSNVIIFNEYFIKTLLYYILTNYTDVDIKPCINPIVPIDVFHPPILATFTHYTINYLPIIEYIHNCRAVSVPVIRTWFKT
ncbi:Endo/exonuclease/phosphatase domain-containing protein, partial [Aphis craccivora]